MGSDRGQIERRLCEFELNGFVLEQMEPLLAGERERAASGKSQTRRGESRLAFDVGRYADRPRPMLDQTYKRVMPETK